MSYFPVYSEVRRWYELLMDPENKQTKGALKKDDGLCCLGLYAENCGFPFRIVKNDDDSYSFRYSVADDFQEYVEGDTVSEDELLPGPAGNLFWGSHTLSQRDPELNVPRKFYGKASLFPIEGQEASRTATSLNDSFGFTFQEIAECVKYTWPEAFEDMEPE